MLTPQPATHHIGYAIPLNERNDIMKTSCKLAVVGGGNLGQAMAAHMALNGYDVTLANRTASKLQPIMDAGNVIELSGVVQGKAKLTAVGGLTEETLGGRDVVMICVPATGHHFIAEQILPFLTPQSHIVLHPGQMFGAFEVHKAIKDLNPELANSITYSEIESALLTSRAPDMGKVTCSAIKDNLGFATLPSVRTKEVLDFFCPLYKDVLKPRANVIETGLTDLNAIVHPIIVFLNAGTIERQSPFLFYHEGVTPHIGSMIERCDMERMALAQALGVQTTSINDWVREEYGAWGSHGDTFYDLIHTNKGHNGIMAPKELYTRYIWEDMPVGVITMIKLGEFLGVETPILRCMHQLGCILFNTDWMAESRTLESLKLAHLSPPELVEFATTLKMKS